MPRSALEELQRTLRARRRGVADRVELVGRYVDDLAPDAHVALVVVVLEHVGSERVAQAVPAALVGVDGQLHAETSHFSGRLSRVSIAPPPRSISGASVAISKSGIALSHSSTATCITLRARCDPRQRCGPPAKPRWLLALRSTMNSSGLS